MEEEEEEEDGEEERVPTFWTRLLKPRPFWSLVCYNLWRIRVKTDVHGNGVREQAAVSSQWVARTHAYTPE